jgi:DNA-binding HxlR family transcriptional regulator
MKQLKLQYPTCPIRNVLERISDKWSLLILCSLGVNNKLRYKELKEAIPDISHKMLTSTLKHLEEYHLVIREAYAEIPPRVEYSLTETGKTLMPSIQQMIDWAQQHFEDLQPKVNTME